MAVRKGHDNNKTKAALTMVHLTSFQGEAKYRETYTAKCQGFHNLKQYPIL